MSGIKTSKVVLDVDHTGFGTVTIDDQPINMVRGVEIKTEGGDLTEVTIRLIAQAVKATVEAAVVYEVVLVTDETPAMPIGKGLTILEALRDLVNTIERDPR